MTLALAVLLVLTMSTLAQEQRDDRPDIIVLYLDDVDPHDARLWSHEQRTPTLARLFDQAGVRFTSAVSETPLCSPGRATLLTGRHTAGHGVTQNEAAPFDPRVTIATEMRGAGYQTMFVGKYLNQLRSEVKAHKLKKHAKGWDVFDVLYEDNGKYYDYRMWTRDGRRRYDSKPADHITLMTKRRLAEHLAEAPTDEPVFAVASIFDLHQPNTPTRKYAGNKRCRRIQDWAPPSYGADVSGKPKWVRKRREFNRPGWPMQTYCEEMLAVDELAAALVRAQRRRGRLDDTLFIFTADNGVAWGIHRLPQRKGVPYATPVPLVMSWPARWGDEVVEIDEVVSNIDLAPTFCDIAGCEMGPFKDGAASADGLSLLPLLDGETDSLARTVVREERGGKYADAPAWRAIRTTARHPLGRWHYTEWATGERELYDSIGDPWELDNLAQSDEYDELLAQLSAELAAEFAGAPTGAGRAEEAAPDDAAPGTPQPSA
jgi:N-acetylglucosamine-6-sulfatase